LFFLTRIKLLFVVIHRSNFLFGRSLHILNSGFSTWVPQT
jgi:hypothetical protein